jgi:hypothetical protein
MPVAIPALAAAVASGLAAEGAFLTVGTFVLSNAAAAGLAASVVTSFAVPCIARPAKPCR